MHLSIPEDFDLVIAAIARQKRVAALSSESLGTENHSNCVEK